MKSRRTGLMIALLGLCVGSIAGCERHGDAVVGLEVSDNRRTEASTESRIARAGYSASGRNSSESPSPLGPEEHSQQDPLAPEELSPQEQQRYLVGEAAKANMVLAFRNLSDQMIAIDVVRSKGTCRCADLQFVRSQIPPGQRGHVQFSLELAGRTEKHLSAAINVVYACGKKLHATRLVGQIHQRPLIEASRSLLILDEQEPGSGVQCELGLTQYTKPGLSFANITSVSLYSGQDLQLGEKVPWSDAADEEGFLARTSQIPLRLPANSAPGAQGADELVIEAELGGLQQTLRVPIRWTRAWEVVMNQASVILTPNSRSKRVIVKGRNASPVVKSVDVPEGVRLASEPVTDHESKAVMFELELSSGPLLAKTGQFRVETLYDGRTITLQGRILVLPSGRRKDTGDVPNSIVEDCPTSRSSQLNP